MSSPAAHPSLTQSRPRRTIKLGGSLLDLPDLPARFRGWLAGQAASENLLVVGGGKLAEALREADQLHHVGDAVAHRLCVRAMSIHAEMVARILGEAVLIRSLREHWPTTLVPRLAVVDPDLLEGVGAASPTGSMLPANWDVTSDSIAAHVASLSHSRELVLLKSTLPEPPLSIENAAATGYVDRYFPRLVGTRVPVRCVNLRDDQFAQVWLT